MKCRKVRELMGAYLYGDLAPDEMRSVRLHAQDCDDCRHDLRTRGAAVSAVPGAVPELADADRQRIFWSVQGALRAGRQTRRSLALRLAPAFGLAAVMALGVGIGLFLSSHSEKPPPQASASAASKTKPAKPRVTVTPNSNTADEPEPSQPRTAQNSEGRNQREPGIALPMRSLPLAIVVPGTSRRQVDRPRRNPVLPDEPLSVVPTPDTELPPDNAPETLPKPPEVDEGERNPDTPQ